MYVCTEAIQFNKLDFELGAIITRRSCLHTKLDASQKSQHCFTKIVFKSSKSAAK